MTATQQYFVAVIGAGPAGLFGARELANKGARVLLLNRDIKPGGLAEYGIYPNKYTMKGGLRKQFRQILELPNLDYYGNITIGSQGDLTLDDLRTLGVQAILVTVGAQGTKWLGLPGEELEGVYHAKDVVYYYNHLPPFSQKSFRFDFENILRGFDEQHIHAAANQTDCLLPENVGELIIAHVGELRVIGRGKLA